MGRWQILVISVLSLVKFPVAWHQLNIIFLAPPVQFQCVDNIDDKCSANCTGYVYDKSTFENTITMEWDLVCTRQYWETLAQTISMFGILVGSFMFGHLSDRYGRRSQLIICMILQFVSSLATAFTPWLSLFLLLRFTTQVATGGSMIIAFVILAEILGVKWRSEVLICYQAMSGLGQMSMSLISYYLRDWRQFQITVSAPTVGLIIAYFLIIPESPRWQLAKGRTNQAINTLKKVAKTNKLPTKNIEYDVSMYLQKRQAEDKTYKVNFLNLLRTPIIRKYTIVLWLNWMLTSLSYQGVSLYIGQLGGNIFINVVIAAAFQIPGVFFASWGISVWGRKRTLLVGNVLCGVTLLLTAVVPSDPFWVKTSLASIGTAGAVASFVTLYIYAGEIFPTVIRNIGLGSSSVFARIGSMIAPFIANLSMVPPWTVPLIFGVIMLFGAGITFMLPETSNCKLPETIEEVEQLEKKKKNKVTSPE